MHNFLYFLLGLALHFLIELFDEWKVNKSITWNVHLFPVAISFVFGIILSIFWHKLNLDGMIGNIIAAGAGFLSNYLLQKLFKWNSITPK